MIRFINIIKHYESNHNLLLVCRSVYFDEETKVRVSRKMLQIFALNYVDLVLLNQLALVLLTFTCMMLQIK